MTLLNLRALPLPLLPNGLFASPDVKLADVVICETAVSSVEDKLHPFLQNMKKGARVLTYHDLAAIYYSAKTFQMISGYERLPATWHRPHLVDFQMATRL